MSAASNIQSVRNFTKTVHSKPNSSTNPSKVRLRQPFVVCVIGASRGIGEGTALAFARAGASGIVLSARSAATLERVAEDVRSMQHRGGATKVETVACDVTSAASVVALADRIRSGFGRLDVVVVNAGWSGDFVLDVTAGETDDFHRATDINYHGTYHAAHALIPLLLASPDGAKAFLAVNSMATHYVDGPTASPQYTISKLAQARLVEIIHNQYGGDKGLLAVAVHPGGVPTQMAKETKGAEVVIPCTFFTLFRACCPILTPTGGGGLMLIIVLSLFSFGGQSGSLRLLLRLAD